MSEVTFGHTDLSVLDQLNSCNHGKSLLPERKHLKSMVNVCEWRLMNTKKSCEPVNAIFSMKLSLEECQKYALKNDAKFIYYESNGEEIQDVSEEMKDDLCNVYMSCSNFITTEVEGNLYQYSCTSIILTIFIVFSYFF